MIKLDEQFYLDCNYELHRSDNKIIKNKKNVIKEILTKHYGKFFKNEKELTTNQYIGELKNAVGQQQFFDFEDKQKQSLEKIFDNIDLFSKNEMPDTLGRIFRHERRENFISDWLAYLLNSEKMGTNILFQSLFHVSGIEGDFIPVGGIEREKDLVLYREDKGTRESCGRIDFFITTDDAIIGIENKIDCDFTSNNQLEKYSKSLRQIAETEQKNWYLFLLYPTSNIKIDKKIKTIKNNKNDNQENVKIITYENLIKNWETIKIDCVKSLRQMIIFEDFIKHIKEYIIMNEKQTLNLLALQFLDDKSKEIEQINLIKSGAISQLFYYINEKAQELNDRRDDWKIHISSGVQYIQCSKNHWRPGVHFELVNIPTKEEFSNFPPKNFYLEFHHEGTKNKGAEWENLSKKVKEENGHCYKLNYKDETEFENAINEMLQKLWKTAKNYADEVDKILENN